MVIACASLTTLNENKRKTKKTTIKIITNLINNFSDSSMLNDGCEMM